MNTGINQKEKTSSSIEDITLKGKTDVCYFSGFGSSINDWELKYSLRSLEQNFLDLRKVYLIGKRPDFIDASKVTYIYFPDEPTGNKDRNLIQKMVYLSTLPQLTENFLMNSDDHFILREIRTEDIKPYIEPKKRKYNHAKLWQRRFMRTRSILEDNGFPAWNYDTHTPHVIQKKSCKEMLKYNFDGGGLTAFSLYFNITLKEEDPTEIPQGVKWDARITNSIKEALFCVMDDSSLDKGPFVEYIEDKFPNKSKYEI